MATIQLDYAARERFGLTYTAASGSEERPVVRAGKIEIAHIMSVTLSCDHRAIDGALGAELIGAFSRLVENPVMMMV